MTPRGKKERLSLGPKPAKTQLSVPSSLLARSYLVRFFVVVSILLLSLEADSVWAFMGEKLSPLQSKVLESAHTLMQDMEISYIYGGASLKPGMDCRPCTACLEQKVPKAKARLAACPMCRHCSLDCSHYTHLVYELAGIKHPYLSTRTMLKSSAAALRKHYFLEPIRHLREAAPGDLLVYKGHVVLLARLLGSNRGDILHATAGTRRTIQSPGQGIQKATNVLLSHYHGSLKRILRPLALWAGEPDAAAFEASKPLGQARVSKAAKTKRKRKSPD